GLLTPTAIGSVLALADDALNAHGAGVLKDRIAVPFKEIDIAESGWCAIKQALERRFTFYIRRGPQVIAVQIEQIECLIDKAMVVALAKLATERMEIGHPTACEHHRLAVKDRLPRFELPCSLCDRLKLV